MKVRRRPAPRELAGLERLYTTLAFVDGLVVSTLDCPRGIHARSHWRADRSCKCPPGTESLKVRTR